MARLVACGAVAAFAVLGLASVGQAGPLYLTFSDLGTDSGSHVQEIVANGNGVAYVVDDQSALPETGHKDGVLNFGLVFSESRDDEQVDVDRRDGDRRGGKSAVSVTGPVPEPASLWLIGSGLLGAVGLGRWRRRRAG